MKSYTNSSISRMNYTYPWNNCIQKPRVGKQYEKEDIVLYAGKNYSLSSGREYIALPKSLKITNEVRRKYNLAW